MITQSRRIRYGILLAVGLAVLVNIPSATPEDKKPRETRGISLHASNTLPLGSQIPALEGYALQIRTIVLKPGAVAGYHSHAKRPVVAYLVKGDYTEHRDGQGVVTHEPGDQWIEGADVAHWSENRGNETTYLINVEVFPTK
jgi:quercetin dioxygenase-like cupin family protein